LIEAFKKVKKKYQKILLIFVGPMEDKKLKYLLKINDEKILFFDRTSEPDKWFSLADILCLPSYREGFGTVVIEAACCGTPTLCSNIYGLKDAVIKNKTGFFHRVGSIDDLKNKMLYVLKNKDLVKKYGNLARKRAMKDFEQSIITKKLLEFIELRISNTSN